MSGPEDPAEDLASSRCAPCRAGQTPLAPEAARVLLARLEGWSLDGRQHLQKAYLFPDFRSALAFVDRIGELAEEEGHHPDVRLSWGRVVLELWTHKIGGLSRADFVFAAKADKLAGIAGPPTAL